MEATLQSETRPLSPEARRRPDFRDGAVVKLLDGNEWTFPAPIVRFGRMTQPDGSRVLGSQVAFALHYREMIDQVDRATDADDREKVILLQLEMAVALVRRNYDLTDEEADSLIQFGWDEEDLELCEMTAALQSVIRGYQPRPKGDTGSGDDPA